MNEYSGAHTIGRAHKKRSGLGQEVRFSYFDYHHDSFLFNILLPIHDILNHREPNTRQALIYDLVGPFSLED
jgi:hypothetical protein